MPHYIAFMLPGQALILKKMSQMQLSSNLPCRGSLRLNCKNLGKNLLCRAKYSKPIKKLATFSKKRYLMTTKTLILSFQCTHLRMHSQTWCMERRLRQALSKLHRCSINHTYLILKRYQPLINRAKLLSSIKQFDLMSTN